MIAAVWSVLIAIFFLVNVAYVAQQRVAVRASGYEPSLARQIVLHLSSAAVVFVVGAFVSGLLGHPIIDLAGLASHLVPSSM